MGHNVVEEQMSIKSHKEGKHGKMMGTEECQVGFLEMKIQY